MTEGFFDLRVWYMNICRIQLERLREKAVEQWKEVNKTVKETLLLKRKGTTHQSEKLNTILGVN